MSARMRSLANGIPQFGQRDADRSPYVIPLEDGSTLLRFGS